MPFNNITTICTTLHSIAAACFDECHSSLEPCLTDATEPSYGNALESCQEFVTNCVYACNNITGFCLPTTYPLNNKYHNGEKAIVILVMFESCLAIAAISLLTKQHYDRIKQQQNNSSLAIGQTLGLIPATIFTILLHDFFNAPTSKFSQNNPEDLDATNIIIAACAIPLILSSIISCGFIFDVGAPVLKSSLLTAYNKCKERAPKIEHIASNFVIGDLETERSARTAPVDVARVVPDDRNPAPISVP